MVYKFFRTVSTKKIPGRIPVLLVLENQRASHEALEGHPTYFYIADDLSLQADPLKGKACRCWAGLQRQKIRNLERMVPMTLRRINRRIKTSDSAYTWYVPSQWSGRRVFGRSSDSSISLNSASCDGSPSRPSLSRSSSALRPPSPSKEARISELIIGVGSKICVVLQYSYTHHCRQNYYNMTRAVPRNGALLIL